MARPKRLPLTQEHLDIEDIRDDVVILKSGTAAAVLQTTAINFDLLSEQEQDSTIFAFAGLLNSLTYPIQILIRSKRVDISNYLFRIAEARNRSHNQSLVTQIENYGNFIRELVSKNQVLDKRFYVVVPYFNVELTQLMSGFGSLLHRQQAKEHKWATLEKAKVNLQPKIDHLIKQFSRLGIRAERLTTEGLVELYYDLYNPEIAREQKAALGTKEYTTPIVEPKIAPVANGENEEVK